jgi:tRNA(fMet)-specific endonuclease VapC
VTYVLDTNAFSALMKGQGRVLDRMRGLRRDQVLVPQPVIAEISYGIARLPRSRRKQSLASLFRRVANELHRCAWTDEVSSQFGAIKADLERSGARIEDLDVAIAAHAVALGAVLVTSNRSHMSRVPGLVIEDWSQD